MTHSPDSIDIPEQWRAMAHDLDIPSTAYAELDGALLKLRRHHTPTAEHSMRVGMLAVRVGNWCGMDPKPLFYGGSLHDFGKVCVQAELLSKTSEWTAADAQALRNHPLDSYEKAMQIGMPVTAAIVVRHHTFQPHAYPENPPQLPVTLPDRLLELANSSARIVALADYYDAAHRRNSAGILSGPEIEAKVVAHNPDVADLVKVLYEQEIFRHDDPWYPR